MISRRVDRALCVAARRLADRRHFVIRGGAAARDRRRGRRCAEDLSARSMGSFAARGSRILGAAGVQLHRQPRAHGRRRACASRRRRDDRVSFSCKQRPCCFHATTARGRSARSAAGADTGAPHGGSAFQALLCEGARVVVSARRSGDRPQSRRRQRVRVGDVRARGRGHPVRDRSTNVQLLAEAFRDEPGPGKYQVGVRYIVVPDRFEAYVSYGNRFNGPSSQWSAIIGIRVQTAAFLP